MRKTAEKILKCLQNEHPKDLSIEEIAEKNRNPSKYYLKIHLGTRKRGKD